MNIEKLEDEITRIVDEGLKDKSYSDVKEELLSLGYNSEEMSYILSAVDERAIFPLAQATTSGTYLPKIVIGSIVCVISLVVVASLYIDKSTNKEIYLVSLALFVVGYAILRSGLKQKLVSKGPDET